MQRCKCTSVIILTLLLFAAPTYASELSGFIAVDNRVFIHSPALDAQQGNSGPSLVIEPEYYQQFSNDSIIVTFKPYVRIDPYDEARQHFDLRQFDWLYIADKWELRAGVSKVFWGVVESNHLVDIINQTDIVEGIDGEEKLGQPMVQFGWFDNWGSLRFYLTPYFRERNFASINGRLRGALPVEDDISLYESSNERFNPDFAIRYEHTIGDWDVGLSHFHGTSREARFKQGTNQDGQYVLFPIYDIIDQTSIDLQYTYEGWLWKLEAMARSGVDRTFVAATGGFEYTFYGVAFGSWDVGVLLEYQFDDRSDFAPATFADNDLFFGSRITLNDVQDTEFLAGISTDTDNNASALFVEASRRIGSNWKVELESFFNFNIKYNNPQASFRRDDYLLLRVARYF